MGKIGEIKREVINVLDLKIAENTPIFIGDTNIKHMQSKHYDDYKKYGQYIGVIINAPDYVGLNYKDDSIEYVKEFIDNGDYVKVAVRVSTNGKYFARSIYVLNKNRVENFIKKKTLKPLTLSKE